MKMKFILGFFIILSLHSCNKDIEKSDFNKDFLPLIGEHSGSLVHSTKTYLSAKCMIFIKEDNKKNNIVSVKLLTDFSQDTILIDLVKCTIRNGGIALDRVDTSLMIKFSGFFDIHGRSGKGTLSDENNKYNFTTQKKD
jgi:hypothetical protein